MTTVLPESWVTEQELISATGANRHTLIRWRQKGLIPRPRRQFLGFGIGTVSEYPSVTIDMVRRLGELRHQSRDADDWLWQLWLDGFPIDLQRWLGAKLDALLKALAPLGDLDAVEAAIPDLPDAGRDSALRLVHGRVRSKPNRNSLTTWAVSVGMGVTPAIQLGDPDVPLFDILRQAAGLSGLWPLPDPELNPEKLSLKALRTCIAEAEPAELDQARSDWKVISELVEMAESANLAFPLIRFLLLLWRDFAVRATMLAFLILIRRSPDHSRNLSSILSAAHALLRGPPPGLPARRRRKKRSPAEPQT
jgi:hypothetical protein